MFPGSSSLNISATWRSDIPRQCRDHLGMIQRVSWQLSVALLEIMLTGNQSRQIDRPVAYKLVCWRWSREAMNWSVTGRKLSALYRNEELSCVSSARSCVTSTVHIKN